MTTRFDKALEQVALESSIPEAQPPHESRAQKVRRLEEIIRAKEATGDRIVMAIGAALVVSAMALPVYAAFLREGQAYLPGLGGPLVMRDGSANERRQTASKSDADATEATGSISRSTEAPKQSSSRRQATGSTPFARYIIHRATEGSALIEGPSGLWWVTPGMKVPGAGQILSIEHSETGWAIITSETTITEVVGYLTN